MHVHLQHQYFLKGGLRDMIENKKINTTHLWCPMYDIAQHSACNCTLSDICLAICNT